MYKPRLNNKYMLDGDMEAIEKRLDGLWNWEADINDVVNEIIGGNGKCVDTYRQ